MPMSARPIVERSITAERLVAELLGTGQLGLGDGDVAAHRPEPESQHEWGGDDVLRHVAH